MTRALIIYILPVPAVGAGIISERVLNHNHGRQFRVGARIRNVVLYSRVKSVWAMLNVRKKGVINMEVELLGTMAMLIITLLIMAGVLVNTWLGFLCGMGAGVAILITILILSHSKPEYKRGD